MAAIDTNMTSDIIRVTSGRWEHDLVAITLRQHGWMKVRRQRREGKEVLTRSRSQCRSDMRQAPGKCEMDHLHLPDRWQVYAGAHVADE